MKRIFRITSVRNYAVRLHYDGAEVLCYSKKQLQALYPNKDYDSFGEVLEQREEKLIKAAKEKLCNLKDKLKNLKPKPAENVELNSADMDFLNIESKPGPVKPKPQAIKPQTGTNEISGQEESGDFLEIDKNEYRIYPKNKLSRVLNREVGYVRYSNDENSYITLLKSNLLFILLAGFLVLALIIGMTIGFASKPAETVPPNLQVDPNAQEWEGEKIEDVGGVTAGIRIPGYKNITIKADKTNASVNLYNPEENNCYFVISIILTDTNETIFTSDLIEPGKGLYDITLSRSLPKGTYNAKLKYETYSYDENLSPLNGAEIVLDLIAK